MYIRLIKILFPEYGYGQEIQRRFSFRQRERRSQNDLKRQFEEFSRNLSFRNRSAKKGGGGGSTNINHPAGGGGGGKRAVEIPSIIAVDEEDVS